METHIDEVADGIYRLSTFFPEVVPPAGFTFNQFLLLADEPLLFHCGLRAMFASSLAAVADRPPRVLADGEVIDLGGKQVRYIDTPHVPHGWDAGVVHEETTATLLCGDLFSQVGNGSAVTRADIVGPATEGEEMFRFTSLGPVTAPTVRKLANLAPQSLALMHGPSFAGDAAGALRSLADWYDERLRRAIS